MPIRMSGMASGLDTDAIIKELMTAQRTKKTNIEGKKTKLEWTKEKWEEMNTKIYSLYTEKLSPLKLEGTFLAKKASSSNEEKVSVSATTAANGAYTLSVKNLASAQYVTGASIKDKEYKSTTKLSETDFNASSITVKTGKDLENESTIEIGDEMTISGLVEKLKSAGLNASFDENTGRFYLSAKDSGADSKFTIESSTSGEGGLEALGLTDIDETMATTGQTAEDSTKVAIVAARDAELVLNGATITSANNTITANGLTIELKGVTAENEVINLSVGNDIDGVYNKIKDMLKGYNELMTEMYDKFNAPSSKGYNVLTDEEKEAMTDEQVKLWEEKIKNSLLRRDDKLSSLMSAMRNSMAKSIEIDGKQYSLSSFGIVTGVYTEHGLLHINGDEDDGVYGSEKDSLKAALEQDPETTAKALSKIFSGLYSDLTDKMSATRISSALTFYNDKQIQTQIDSYTKQISSWEEKLQDMEDRYYKQFSSMEKSMAELQQKQNQLAGFLGQ